MSYLEWKLNQELNGRSTFEKDDKFREEYKEYLKMSTENHSQEIKVGTNILNFQFKENHSCNSRKNLMTINTINSNKDGDDRFDQLPLIQEEILLLSNHGETIEFPQK